jgi:pyruvate/2-oxoglutarate dehydrogenase complex dihydrolipoamide acyltransferase (E2) component
MTVPAASPGEAAGAGARGGAAWRKLASATWAAPRDPQIYGDIEVDASAALAFLDGVRAATGTRVTVTHLVARAVAHTLGAHPDLNVRMRRGAFVPRDSVDIFVVADLGGGDLSGVKVRHADRMSLVELAREIEARVGRVRTGDDAALGATKRIFDALPARVLAPAFRLATWLTMDRDLDLARIGLPREAFGSAMVTSVGMFGIQHAYAPLSPYYRVAFLALVSEVAIRPVVAGGEVVARPVLNVAATLDHRYLDGAQAGRLARTMREYLESPATFEPPAAAPPVEAHSGA